MRPMPTAAAQRWKTHIARATSSVRATSNHSFVKRPSASASGALNAPDFATSVAQTMLVFHAGQGCAVQSRLLVPKSRYDEAVAILTHAYKAFEDKWGHFDEPSCPMGPVISKKQLDGVKAYIDIGVAEGARRDDARSSAEERRDLR